MFKFFKTYRRLLKETISIYDSTFLPVCIVVTLLKGFLPVLIALMPKLITATLISGQTSSEKVRSILLITAIYAAVGMLMAFFGNYIEQSTFYIRDRTRMKYARNMMARLYAIDFIQFESEAVFAKHEKAFDATSSPTTGINGAMHGTLRISANLLGVFFLLILLWQVNPIVALAMILYGYLYFRAENTKNFAETEELDEANKLTHRKNYFKETTGSFDYAKDIRLYRFQERLLSLYKQQIVAYRKIMQGVRKTSYKAHIIPTSWLVLVQLYFLHYLLNSYANGTLAVDTLLMSFGLSYQLIMLMDLTVGDFAFYIAHEMIYVKSLYEFLDDDDLLPPSGTRTMPAGPLSIEFKNVSFRYPNSPDKVLENLNLSIAAGETVALVGNNGAGKSTLIKLLVGLYRPDSGEILINGINLNEFSYDERLKIFNSVFQTVLLYPLTVKENVAGREDNLDLDRIWSSLAKAGLKEKIESLKYGLDTLLTRGIDPESVELSGGESQKLAISRAIYKDGPITILDEPTAALDALAEAEIYENLNSISAGKTSIYISHRLSSTKFCDRIFLLADKAVAEVGTHRELMAMRGEYYEMFITQGKYYREEQKRLERAEKLKQFEDELRGSEDERA
ncbi:MAG: ABC transporter ATP-binding protein [Eubacteriales bacterium]|nr:ABC transporter ATP-binding protein [Eubacteriales bacterium]